mmetsp:Transcript_20807/g.18199  ORF Transcript_20807/g.18199 Transcript_20807/m.18199 type:complete len:97 (-) Transcript_20807:80-370(-)
MTSIKKFTLEEFLNYKDILQSGNNNEKYDVITKIRKASSIDSKPPLDLIRRSDVIPILMLYHKDNSLPDNIMQDILWTITNVASGNSDDTLYIAHL